MTATAAEGGEDHTQLRTAGRQPQLPKEGRTYTAAKSRKTTKDDDRRKTTTAAYGKMTTAFLIF
jgi:hypothetical protein